MEGQAMFDSNCFFKRLFCIAFPVFALGLFAAHAQEATLDEIKYREDYNRIKKMEKVDDPVKRADQFVTFYSERPDLDPKLRDYSDSVFARDLESLHRQGNYSALKGICERVLKYRPKFGEVYMYYGVALKNEKKLQEAMDAFAKCYLTTNPPLRTKAKQQLDITYRAFSGGSLIGEQKIIDNALKELKK
jgi:tetratricopeptide (TPR) repeat protein